MLLHETGRKTNDKWNADLRRGRLFLGLTLVYFSTSLLEFPSVYFVP